MQKIFSQEGLIYLAVFLLPLYLARVKIVSLSSNLWEIFFALIFFTWIFRRWKKINFQRFYDNWKKYIFSGGLIFSGLLFSAIANGNNFRSFGIIKSWFLIPIMFTLMAGDIIPREKIKNIFWVYYLSAFFTAIIALEYLFFGHLSFDGRLSAIFNSPNYLAMYLAPGIIIGAAILGKIKKFIFEPKIIFLVASFAIILSAFYKTYSYAAWIAVFLSVLTIFLIQKKLSPKKIALIAGIIVLLALSQSNNNKFNSLISSNPRSSLASRAIIWQSAGKMIANNPVWGIGPGNFQAVYLQYQKYFPPYLEWAAPHPHNLYLDFWLSGGLLGLSGFLALLVFYFRDIAKKIISEDIINKNVLSISLAIMLYILIHGLVDTTYFKNDLATVFWLCFLALK